MGEEWTLWNTIEKRRTRWIGHTLRHHGFLENILGGVPRGRPRDKCMEQMKKKVHRKNYQEVSQPALDRVGWRPQSTNLRIERLMKNKIFISQLGLPF
jgi:hypothetical protein